MLKYITKCRACGCGHLVKILNLGKQTIQGSFVYPGKTAPPKRAIDSNILFCEIAKGGCGLVQNEVTIDPELLYSNYGYRSSVSNTMTAHLTEIAGISNTFPDSKSVLDIGANDGFLLRQFPAHFNRVGVDPSDIAKEAFDLNIINDFFPSAKINEKFDIITSIACFYDINDPTDFCVNIKKCLSENGVWILEFAYLPAVLRNNAYDGMVSEHVCLYSFSTLNEILKKSGLCAINAFKNDTNGGSLQVWVSHSENTIQKQKKWTDNLLEIKVKEFDLELDSLTTYQSFANRVLERRCELVNLVGDILNSGKAIHILGMSTKLNTILNFCDIGPDQIKFASERTKEKIGAKTISGIEMISEEDSRAMKPDYYLVGPYHFKEEISRREAMAGNKARLIFPLPNVEIV